MAPRVRSPYCEQARRAARPNNQWEERLIALLDEPIAETDVVRLERRLRALEQLVDSMDRPSTTALFRRLSDSNDPLTRFFDCELHHATRANVRQRLGQRGFEPSPDPIPDDRGIDNRGVQPPVPPHVKPPQPPEPAPPPPPRPPPRRPPGPDLPPLKPPKPRVPHLPVDLDPRDLIRRGEEILEEESRRKNPDHGLISRVRSLLRRAQPILAIAAPVIGLYVLRNGRLVQALITSDWVKIRILSRFEDQMKDELEDILRDLADIDENYSPEPDEPATPPSEPPVRVDPTARGHAVEDVHVDRLRLKGYESLPPWFPGIDSVKGNASYVPTPGGKLMKLYQNVDAVSVKSTQSVGRKYLTDKLTDEWLPALRPPFSKTKGNVTVRGLRKKAIHLIFEEGVVPRIDRDVLKTLAEMKAKARKESVDFEWFVFVAGSEERGPEFMRRLKKP